jgi:hypothetical protein
VLERTGAANAGVANAIAPATPNAMARLKLVVMRESFL